MKKSGKEKPPHSVKFLRQRKFLLVLPVLVLPFLIILLWTLGLVGEVKAAIDSEKKIQGMNLTLPGAAPAKDSNWSKLKYYEQADKDSIKLRSWMKNDPYRRLELEAPMTNQRLKTDTGSRYSYNPYLSEKEQDHNEQRVYKKLAALNQELETAAVRERQPKLRTDTIRKEITLPAGDVDRLEKMMQSMQQEKGEDAEMKQYNELLEKILDVQNPERVQEKLRRQSEQHKRQVFMVEKPVEDVTSILETKKDFQALLSRYQSDSMPPALQEYMDHNRFYSLDETFHEMVVQRSIPSVVHEDQVLVNGATIKFRLLEDMLIAGVLIPKDHFVHGVTTLNGERLQVAITSIEYMNHLLPVALTVYDKKDGLPGIHIPGAITRDVAKKSAAQSAQGLGAINTLDPSIGAQAVSAGLQATQNLIGKTAKLVRATVTAGYPVLLRDDNREGQ